MGDRLGVRRALAQIVLAWSVFTALTGAAWNMMSIVVIRFLFGAGEAGCFPNLTRMLSAWLPARERVTAQALMWACARWGGAITPPLTLLCITWFGWRWAFVGFAAAGTHLVGRVPGLVQRRSGRTSGGERGGMGVARGVASSNDA